MRIVWFTVKIIVSYLERLSAIILSAQTCKMYVKL